MNKNPKRKLPQKLLPTQTQVSGVSNNSIFDITLGIAIESLFEKGKTDYFACLLAGKFADLYVYSENIKFFLPVSSSYDGNPEKFGLPKLLGELRLMDSGLLVPEQYSTDKLKDINEADLKPSFDAFSVFARNQESVIKMFSSIFSQDWVKKGHLLRINTNCLYPVQKLSEYKDYEKLIRELNITSEELNYVFDVVFRYISYSKLAGDNYYLAYTLREIVNLPIPNPEKKPKLHISISLAKSISGIVNALSRNQYVTLLGELRRFIREKKINLINSEYINLGLFLEDVNSFNFSAEISAVAKEVLLRSLCDQTKEYSVDKENEGKSQRVTGITSAQAYKGTEPKVLPAELKPIYMVYENWSDPQPFYEEQELNEFLREKDIKPSDYDIWVEEPGQYFSKGKPVEFKRTLRKLLKVLLCSKGKRIVRLHDMYEAVDRLPCELTDMTDKSHLAKLRRYLSDCNVAFKSCINSRSDTRWLTESNDPCFKIVKEFSYLYIEKSN